MARFTPTARPRWLLGLLLALVACAPDPGKPVFPLAHLPSDAPAAGVRIASTSAPKASLAASAGPIGEPPPAPITPFTPRAPGGSALPNGGAPGPSPSASIAPSPSPSPSPSPTPVSTWAGSGAGSAGASDGPGSQASFNGPTAVAAVASTHSLLVADTGNNTLRLVAGDGTVSTLVGPTGASASFNRPMGLAMEASGTIAVSEAGGHRISRVDASGNVSPVAGSVLGYLDGPAGGALFNDPRGLATDGANNLYVADRGNHAIRQIGPDGSTRTLAGGNGQGYRNGPGAQAQFAFPTALAVAGSTLYVADSGNHAIRAIDAAGNVTTYAGGTVGNQNGPAPQARFGGPVGLAIDPTTGTLLVSEANYPDVRAIGASGAVVALAGSLNLYGLLDGAWLSARFNGPAGLAVLDGVLFVADTKNNDLRAVLLPPAF